MSKKLILILGLAWACRLAYIFLFSHGRLVHIDELNYYMQVDSMLSGNRLSIFYHPPLYPLFLLWFFKIFGVSFPALQAFQAFLGLFTCGLVFLLGRRVSGERAGLIAAFAYAVSFRPVRMPAELLSETLFTFLLISAVWAFIRALGTGPAPNQTLKPGWPGALRENIWPALAGILFGLAGLTRAVILGLPFLLAVYFLAARYKETGIRSLLRPAGSALIFLMAFAFTLAPWANLVYKLSGRFMPGGAAGGNTFFWHNTELMWEPGTDYLKPEYSLPDLKGYSAVRGRPLPPEALHPNIRRMQEIVRGYYRHADQSDRFFSYTFDYLSQLSPAGIIRLAWLKIYRLALPFHPYYNPAPDLTFLLALPFFILALVWRIARPKDGWNWVSGRSAFGVLWLLIGYLLLSVLFFGGMPRYRDPFDPYIIIIAVTAGMELFSRLKSARPGQPATWPADSIRPAAGS